MINQNEIRPAARSAGRLVGWHQHQMAALAAMGLSPTGRRVTEHVLPLHVLAPRGMGKSTFAADWRARQQQYLDGQAEIRRAVKTFIQSIR